jgi:hypothetical protein
LELLKYYSRSLCVVLLKVINNIQLTTTDAPTSQSTKLGHFARDD